MATAKFEEVAAQLTDRIRREVYSTAQKLPSEYDLAKEFEVSRLTIRKAIDLLIKQQLLVKSPGKGTYVMSGVGKVESGRMGLQGFTEAAKAYGRTSRTEVLQFEPLTDVSDKISDALALKTRLKPEVDLLIRRRFWNEDPMTIEYITICHEYVEDYEKADFEGSLFALLEKKVEIAYSHEAIEATLVNEKMAELLNLKVGEPLMKVNSVTYTADAKPIFYDTSYYRADKYTFRSTLTRFKQ
ncbi:GntR family transcriptional regulator, LSA1692 subfamily [Agrilactobacillus yilanensis]|uniref:GntR family transcriptional regulator, LSA1692 subfamily n=1 Tax=Agrilactobacillus yilanensis TaxID=2485997 RepID=A0ABW4J447_9LACO|nr:GntR family transcriptional regulator, LSA1692 subfamily [Agrilactobacillus yilanensis]